jgi:hypothetical protein
MQGCQLNGDSLTTWMSFLKDKKIRSVLFVSVLIYIMFVWSFVVIFQFKLLGCFHRWA